MNFSSRLSRFHWYHWLIVSLSIALTLFAWKYSDIQEEKRIRLKFNSEAQRITDLVRERLELYESALFGGVAAIKLNNDKLTRTDWNKFSTSLNIDKKYPGISGIGVIYKVLPQNLKEHLAEQRELKPDYHLHPKHSRDEFWPITYIEPEESNKKAVGLDMAHEENRFTAVKKAEETGLTQITGPIILVQDSAKTPGFLFYAPFYRNGENKNLEERDKNFIGVVYAPFVVKKLMEGTLKNTNRSVNFSISDNGATLFNEHGLELEDHDSNPLYRVTKDLKFYGRTWNFDIRSSLSFRENAESGKSFFILIFGIIVDSLLFFFFIVLSSSNAKAVKYANQVTSALKKSNEELQQFAYRTSHDLVSPLKSISGLVVCAQEDLEDNDTQEVGENLSRISSLTKKLTDLVGEILDLAKADNVNEELQKINFSEIENNITEKLSILIAESGVEVSFENHISADIYSQRTRILQIIENLVSNSIKYHDPDKAIKTVKVIPMLKEEELHITVQDNGLGIPKEFQKEVFQMFKRFNPDTSYGSGLGLYLVKKHVESLDGRISFTSDEQETNFLIEIKVKKDKGRV